MKKHLVVLSSLILTTSAFANKYSQLAGTWEGKVVKNIKETSAGGKPNMETENTPAKIELAAKGDALEGKSMVGKDTETWNFDAKADTYTWTDSEMKVTAKATTDIPEWVKTEIGMKPADKVHAFKFQSCTLTKNNQACKVKEHYPEGMDNSGFWVFKVDGSNLSTSVLYKYPSGKVRHLAENLTKK